MDFLIVFTAYALGIVFLGIAVWAGMRLLGFGTRHSRYIQGIGWREV